MSTMSYRVELDGVRGLTILGIVMFHLGFPSLAGGFVVIDVFFVLSGYLICGQAYLKLLEGNFSATDFFARRIRRLAPAYGLCFLVASLMANAFFLRSELQMVAENLLGAITFTNNFNLMGSAGYFAGPNTENPFLHTWSLSIEEQFYIVMPLLILLFMRSARAFVWVLGIVFAVSLALNLFTTDQIYTKDERYFSTLYRIWAVAAGGLAFLMIHHGLVPRRIRGLAFAGALMILVPIFVFDSSYLYPSWITIFPVGGTLLMLFYGDPGQSLTGRAFAVRPMVYLGKITYGTYLWHWPLIVAVIYYGTHMTDVVRSVILIVSFILGALSYHFVETPFRAVSVKNKGKLFVFFAVQTAVLIALVFYIFHQSGKADAEEAPRISALKEQVDKTHDRWDLCWDRMSADTFCRMGVDKDAPDFFLWGDSMANSALPAFDAYGRARGEAGRLATAPGCAPIDGGAPDADCLAVNAAVLDYIETRDPMDVFLLSSWSYLAEGMGHFGTVPGEVPMLLDDGTMAPENFPEFMKRLEMTLQRISPRHNVVIIQSFPKYKTSIPKAMLRNLRFGAQLPVETRENYGARETRTNEALEALALKYGATLLSPQDMLCETGTCIYEIDGLPLYSDSLHLSERGNAFLLEMLFDVMGQERDDQ
ncbi:MAG: acyltransferase family protein [Pseudomonadota bacterium]